MKLGTFFDKFGLFADAPDAVGKMRELVLELAVQGKVVVQDPNEEPASKLLHRVLRNRGRASESERHDSTSSIGEAAQPYAIPNGWLWTRWDTVATKIGDIDHKMPDETADGIPYVSPRDFIPGNRIDFDRAKRISHEDFLRLSAKIKPELGDLIYPRYGTIGECRLVTTKRDFLASYSCAVIKTMPALVDPRYQYFFSISSLCRRQARAAENKTTQANVGIKSIKEFRFPLPPLAEQKRIVAKVDELMALCDRLEAQQRERQTQHTALARASLARFADAPTPVNLDFLFHKSYAIPPAELRSSILTLAVQGKLVAQDPEEEPVDRLIARIAVLRRSKAQKQYEPVDESEAPYEIPSTWAWVRLGNLALSSDSGWSPQCLPEPRSGSNWGVLKVSAVSWGSFRPEENKALPPGMEARPGSEVKAGDFLLSRANTEELVARSVVVDQAPPRLMMSDKIVRFRFSDDIERAYINLANTSYASRDYYSRNASGTSSSMKNIGREVMCNLPIPLPPLPEQRRIVARVVQLMALVEKLELNLTTARATAENLSAAIVAGLTLQD